MCSLWLLSIVAIFIADVRTGALQQKDLSPRRCYHCAHKSRCGVTSSAPVVCPAGQPLCATVASAPNFTSTLTCAAASESPCSLIHNSKLALEMTCVCDNDLCNAPYTSQLRNELFNFSTKIPTNASSELTEIFLKSSVYENVTKAELFKTLTKAMEKTNVGTQSSVSLSIIEDVPRAEALKHEATVPPDDDEDESEGSGSYEEVRTQASPAAPSSYLPADENSAASLANNALFTVLAFYIVIL